MNEVLTQDEIDKLLAAISSGEDEIDSFKPVKDTRKIKIYDFHRPDVLSKEQLRFMANVVEENLFRLIKLWKKVIPNLVHMHVASVDDLTFEEYMRSLITPSYSMLAMSGKYPIMINMGPTGPKFFEEDLNAIGEEDLPPKRSKVDWLKLSDEEVKKKLAANAKKRETNKQKFLEDLRTGKKKFADKDWSDEFVKKVVGPMIKSFMTLIRNDLSRQIEEPRHFKVETNTAFVGSSYEHTFKDNNDEYFFQPGSMVLLFTLETLYLDGTEDMTTICLPWKLVVEMIDKYNGTFGNKEESTSFDDRFLNDIKIPIEVSLGKALRSISEIRGMGEGTIIELDKLAGDTVDIKVGGTTIAKGEVVVIDENFGVRVTECKKRR